MHYVDRLREKTASTKKALDEHNGELALASTQECKSIANHIARISPQDNPSILCTIEYAKTIMAVDQINHPNIKEADLGRLQECYESLSPLFLTHAKQVKPVLNELLERQINCLIEQIRVPTAFDSSADLRELFLTQHQSQIDALQKCLTQLIALSERDTTKEIRPILAKAYFLKADIIHFYERDKGGALPHFKKAAEIMPENYYYCFHYYGLSNDKRRDDAEAKIRKVSNFHFDHFELWKVERWNADRVMSDFDIHRVPPKDPGVLTKIGNMFSG